MSVLVYSVILAACFRHSQRSISPSAAPRAPGGRAREGGGKKNQKKLLQEETEQLPWRTGGCLRSSHLALLWGGNEGGGRGKRGGRKQGKGGREEEGRREELAGFNYLSVRFW